jgi:ATP-dependent helicase/nuclease subunit A
MITAGAGSGKTFILVKRIIALLAGDYPGTGPVSLDKIIALTFTRKAAAEMRTRVYRGLSQRISEEKNPDAAHRLERVKDLFHSANISTLNSFAASLIRNHPIELGIDPDFRIPDDLENSGMVTDSIDRTLDLYWKSRPHDMLGLLEIWNLWRIRRELRALVQKTITLTEALKSHSKPDLPEFIGEIRNAQWERFQRWLTSEGGGFDALMEMRAFCLDIKEGGGSGKAAKQRKEKAGQYLEQFIDQMEKDLSSQDLTEFNPDAIKELEATAKRIGDIRGWPGQTPIKFCAMVNDLTEPWLSPLDRDKQALAMVDLILEIARDALADLRDTQYQRSMLSHDDVMLLAEKLCRDESKIAQYRAAHLLVDEFQDTDPVQWAIIRSIASSRTEIPENLFLVGDTKQAIYQFRGADHTVTSTAGSVLSALDPEMEVSLDENFRSNAPTLNFTNLLFRRLFTPEGPDPNPYAAIPQDLVPMREARGESESDSSVNILAYDAQSGDQWNMEACATADLLSDIRDGLRPDFAGIHELMSQGAPAVGILFRTHSAMEIYIQEFRRRELPFSVYRGRTFFKTPEAASLMNLLAWLGSKTNDVALAGLLRSPLFNWKDEDLAAVRIFSGPARSLWEQLQTICAASGPQLTVGLDPGPDLEKLRRLIHLNDHLSLTETIRAALDITMAHFTFGQASRTGRSIANLEKFLDLARIVESEGHVSPLAAHDALMEMAESAEAAAEAEVLEGAEASIQLMTIHSSKGLEFPMVIPGCPGKSGQRGNIDFAVRISVDDPDNPGHIARMTLCGLDWPKDDENDELKPTMLKSFLNEHSSLQLEAENRRLLYVALTRAMDNLVIPLGLKKNKVAATKGTHGGLLISGLPELHAGLMNGDERVEIDQARIRIEYAMGQARQESVQGPEYQEQLIRKVHDFEVGPHGPGPLTQAMPYPRKMRVTVSDLMIFAKCPRRFYLERFFPIGASHLFEDIQTRVDPDMESMELDYRIAKGRTLGNLFHWAMERYEAIVADYDPQAGSGHGPNIPGLGEMAAIMCRSAGIPEESERIERLALSHMTNIAASGILKDNGLPDSHDLKPMREASFRLDIEDFNIVGKIDRVTPISDNGWSVWDYKTSGLKGRSKEEVARDRNYDLQILVYAWAAQKILQAPINSGALIFSADPDPLFFVDLRTETPENALRDILSRIRKRMEKGLAGFETSGQRDLSCAACAFEGHGLC